MLFVAGEMQPKADFQEKNSMVAQNLKGPISHFHGILLILNAVDGLLLT